MEITTIQPQKTLFSNAFNYVVLAVVAAATRLLFFGWPAQMVFDEIYSGNFFTAYAQGTFFFDVHPPLARLLIYAWGLMTGAPAVGLDSLKIGSAIAPGFVLIRLLPILAGILLPLVVYAICRRLNLSKVASFTAGFLVACENSLIVQSRFVLTDGLLLIFGFGAILFYLIYHRLIRAPSDATRPWYGSGRIFLWLSAVLAAAAGGVKWTGLAFILSILAYECIFVFLTHPDTGLSFWRRILTLVRMVAIYLFTFVVFYIALFAVHFALLPRSGPGDAFMTPQFQKTLLGNANATNTSIQAKGFFGKLTELNSEMYTANRTIPPTADYASKWYTWPFMVRTIFYWQGNQQYIYLLGNPVAYALGSASIFILVEYALRLLVRRRRISVSLSPEEQTRKVETYRTLAIILVGYFLNYLPFIFIGRVMFLYHYEAALVWSIIAVAFIVQALPRGRWRVGVMMAVLIISFMCYRYFSPLTYGTRLTDQQLQARMWLPTWR